MNHRRTGKIARLPEEIRSQVNQFLDDGLEYRRIIEWLDQQVSNLRYRRFPTGSPAIPLPPGSQPIPLSTAQCRQIPPFDGVGTKAPQALQPIV